MASHVLATVHLSNIYSTSQTIAVPTNQPGLAIDNETEQVGSELELATTSTSLYDPATGRIFARVINDRRTLELTQASADQVPIRFLMPSRVLATPGLLFERKTSSLHVIVLTEGNLLYRLSFHTPGLFNTAPLPRSWCKEYVVKGGLDADCPIQVLDVSTVLVGMRDGGLLKLEQTRMSRPETVDGLSSFYDSTWKETPIRPSSLYNALTSFIPFTSGSSYDNPAHVLSIDAATSDELAGFAFSISRDRRLRIWNLQQNTCIRTDELPATIPSGSGALAVTTPSPSKRQHVPLLSAEPRRLVRTVPLSTSGAAARTSRVLVFIPTPSAPDNAGFFLLYDFHASSGHFQNLAFVGQKACSSQSAHSTIRDFLVSDGRLWVLWDQQGRGVLESTPLDFSEFAQSRANSKWTVVAIPEEPDLSSDRFLEQPSDTVDEESVRTLVQTYKSALTVPDLFSPFTLSAALKEYEDQLVADFPQAPLLAAMSTKQDTTMERISAVVACTVQLDRDQETGLWRWDMHKESLKREWERFVAVCIELERAARAPLALSQGKAGEVVLQDRERVGVVAEIESSVAGKSEKAFLELARAVVDAAGTQAYADFVEEALATVRAPLELNTVDACVGIYERTMQPEVLVRANELLNGLREVVDLDLTVKAILKQLTKISAFGHEEAAVEGEVFNGWVTSYICSLAKSRYDRCLAIFALLAFLPSEARDAMKDPTDLLGEALVVVHSVSTLWYICQQLGGNPLRKSGPAGAEEDFATRFGRLQVAGDQGGNTLRRNIDYCLVHSLLPEVSRASEVRVTAFEFIESSGLLHPRKDIGILLGDAKFLNELRLKGYLSVVAEVASWYPKSPAVSYVLGRALLDGQHGEEATVVLNGVASAFDDDTTIPLQDKQALHAVFPIPAFKASPSFIYQQIASWFEQAGFLSHAIPYWTLAIHTASSHSVLDHLWYKISAAQIELGLFEDAYGTLMKTPYRDQQDNTLRKLIDVMCTVGEGDKLVRMSFDGLQATVEEILDFKARNHDPLQPPDYSAILYSWHVSRGNYRSAGAAMYHHGRRLGALSDPKLDYQAVTVEQAHAYLAAINCLSLVDSRNAWVVSAKADRETGDYPSTQHHIPVGLFTEGTQELELTRVEDIRREYALTLARLELLPHLQELGTTSITLSLEDAVAAFAQFGLYDSAFNAAASMNVDMVVLFKDLARKCASIPSYIDADAASVAPWLDRASERIAYWDGTTSEKAWRYLRECLERYDLATAGYRYHKDVLESVLSYNRHNRVPNWLSKFFEENQPEYLIRMLLRYGLVQDAATYIITMIRKSNGKLALLPGVTETWLPYSLIQSVIDFAQKSDEVKAKVLAENVETMVAARIREMDNRSRLVAQTLVTRR